MRQVARPEPPPVAQALGSLLLVVKVARHDLRAFDAELAGLVRAEARPGVRVDDLPLGRRDERPDRRGPRGGVVVERPEGRELAHPPCLLDPRPESGLGGPLGLLAEGGGRADDPLEARHVVIVHEGVLR